MILFIFLFGWGHVTQKQYGPTMAVKCPNCNNDTWLHLFGFRKWFTLFFIPVIPYESTHLLLCPICSHGLELEGEQIERAKSLSALTGAYLNKQIPESHYLHEAEQLRLLPGV